MTKLSGKRVIGSTPIKPLVDSSKYKCIKCKDIVQPPVYQFICGDRICEVCLEEERERSSNVCPGAGPWCNSVDLTTDPIPDKAVVRDLNKLLTECDFRVNGCYGIVKLGQLRSHKESCLYRSDGFVTDDSESSTGSSEEEDSDEDNDCEKPREDKPEEIIDINDNNTVYKEDETSSCVSLQIINRKNCDTFKRSIMHTWTVYHQPYTKRTLVGNLYIYEAWRHPLTLLTSGGVMQFPKVLEAKLCLPPAKSESNGNEKLLITNSKSDNGREKVDDVVSRCQVIIHTLKPDILMKLCALFQADADDGGDHGGDDDDDDDDDDDTIIEIDATTEKDHIKNLFSKTINIADQTKEQSWFNKYYTELMTEAPVFPLYSLGNFETDHTTLCALLIKENNMLSWNEMNDNESKQDVTNQFLNSIKLVSSLKSVSPQPGLSLDRHFWFRRRETPVRLCTIDIDDLQQYIHETMFKIFTKTLLQSMDKGTYQHDETQNDAYLFGTDFHFKCTQLGNILKMHIIDNVNKTSCSEFFLEMTKIITISCENHITNVKLGNGKMCELMNYIHTMCNFVKTKKPSEKLLSA